jgi:hypothetical protein
MTASRRAPIRSDSALLCDGSLDERTRTGNVFFAIEGPAMTPARGRGSPRRYRRHFDFTWIS